MTFVMTLHLSLHTIAGAEGGDFPRRETKANFPPAHILRTLHRFKRKVEEVNLHSRTAWGRNIMVVKCRSAHHTACSYIAQTGGSESDEQSTVDEKEKIKINK
jgi:hypothetical protein